VQLTDRARDDVRTLENLQVSGPAGTFVPLGSIAEISFGSGPAQIDRLDRQRYAAVEAETGGIPLGTASKQIHDLPIFKNLPSTVTELKYGDAEQMAQLFGSIGIALATGIFMVYAVLVILFGSFIQPLTIMTALPLSLGGAVTLMLLTRTGFSLPALIGTLMLMGIVAKNSILLVEYAVVAMRDRRRPQARPADCDDDHRYGRRHAAYRIADRRGRRVPRADGDLRDRWSIDVHRLEPGVRAGGLHLSRRHQGPPARPPPDHLPAFRRRSRPQAQTHDRLTGRVVVRFLRAREASAPAA
jgi:hypothetical protein